MMPCYYFIMSCALDCMHPSEQTPVTRSYCNIAASGDGTRVGSMTHHHRRRRRQSKLLQEAALRNWQRPPKL